MAFQKKKKWIGMSGLERDGELLFCGKWLSGDIWSDGEELAMHRSGRNFPGRWGNKNLRSEISRMPEEYVRGRCSWSRWRQGRVAGQTPRGLLDRNLSVVAPLRSLPSRQAMPNSLLTLRTAARQASLSFTTSQSLVKLRSIASVMPSNHLMLCRPLLLLPSIFPSIRVSSSESLEGPSRGVMPSDWVISRTGVLVYISKMVDFGVFFHSIYSLGP